MVKLKIVGDYPFEIRPLDKDEGGGFLISYSDFSECIADGETIEEAIANGRSSLEETIATLKARNFPVPAPNSGGSASGKFVARVPKSVHAQLAARAKVEGVSLNSLVLAFIAEGLGRRDHLASAGPLQSPRRGSASSFTAASAAPARRSRRA